MLFVKPQFLVRIMHQYSEILQACLIERVDPDPGEHTHNIDTTLRLTNALTPRFAFMLLDTRRSFLTVLFGRIQKCRKDVLVLIQLAEFSKMMEEIYIRCEVLRRKTVRIYIERHNELNISDKCIAPTVFVGRQLVRLWQPVILWQHHLLTDHPSLAENSNIIYDP